MATLSRELRKLLENTVVEARNIAEKGAKAALESLAVDASEPFSTCERQRELRRRLRARGRQLGDTRDKQGKQSILHLTQACAYEHWHRMLFARFLAENGFLLDPDYQVSLSMSDVRERARELGRDWLDVASEFAQRMLLDVFRPGDPVLEVAWPPEKRQQLETQLERLPPEIFRGDDSLGWVYQFWQKEEKDRVNRSETKIGADQLAAVTQLFTEDYMVLFLLHNTLGAWWTARRGSPALDGYEWSYLRLNEDGTPAAGTFGGWPKRACELRVLDPCMGSGHFLAFALPIIAHMRMVEEDLSLQAAIYATLRDNLFGLELDERCSQIAAFNLALTAWRLAGELFELPPLRLACSGIPINAPESDWTKLATNDSQAFITMQKLYELFQKAPILGSLIDPTSVGDLLTAQFDQVQRLLDRALAEQSLPNDERELAISAKGLLAAARILEKRFTLVMTNVPYLGRGKQHGDLASFCKRCHEKAKADLATCFVDRCITWCSPAGSVALVTPQSWLFQGRYRSFRKALLRRDEWNFVGKLGPRAFETITGEVVKAALIGITRKHARTEHVIAGLDVTATKSPKKKSEALLSTDLLDALQSGRTSDSDSLISFGQAHDGPQLATYAGSYQGLCTSDDPQFIYEFWEIPVISEAWRWLQSAAEEGGLVGGLSSILHWENGSGRYYRHAQALKAEGRLGGWKSGGEAWAKRGIAVNVTSNLFANLYLGELFDNTIAAIIPSSSADILAILAFCQSPEYRDLLKRIDPSLSITELTLLKVPFDLSYWQERAATKYPSGVATIGTDDPRQCLFDGHPNASKHPVQVAVARLLGYRWPRQSGSSFVDCPASGADGLEKHAVSDGILGFHASHGQEAAHVQLRALLADAFGEDWSAQKMSELVGDAETLENWLLKRFFREHCEIFHARPFIWHVWDGRKDGFNALVNYHKLAGPNGEGRRTLERLIYTYLGDWIRIQESQIGKVDGADARLVAAQHLKQQLEAILKGEPPFDIFVRWKPIHEQPIGWEPDLNDGVRLNMRPWLNAKPYEPEAKRTKRSRQNTCILREMPIKLPLGKDRGKEPRRDANDFPWFAASTDRTNDIHLTIAEKQAARDRKARK